MLTVQPWQPGGVLAGTTRGLVQLVPTPAGWRPRHIGSEALEIRSLFRDKQDTVWIGAADGLWRLSNDRVVHENLGPRSEMLVLSISPATGGGLWLGDGQWLYRWNGAAPVPLTLPAAADFATVTFARADRSQRVWLGSGRKIGVLEPDGSFHVLGPENGLDSRSQLTLYDVFEDNGGVVWLGTSDGLSRFSDGR